MQSDFRGLLNVGVNKFYAYIPPLAKCIGGPKSINYLFIDSSELLFDTLTSHLFSYPSYPIKLTTFWQI